MRALSVDTPSVKVLNYAPGPVDTDMIKVVAGETWNDETGSAIRGISAKICFRFFRFVTTSRIFPKRLETICSCYTWHFIFVIF